MLEEKNQSQRHIAGIVQEVVGEILHKQQPEGLATILDLRNQSDIYNEVQKLLDSQLPLYHGRIARYVKDPNKRPQFLFVFEGLAHQFATEAFCLHIDQWFREPVENTSSNRWAYRVSLEIYKIMEAYNEKLQRIEDERRQVEQAAILQQRAQKFISADHAQEAMANISASEKVIVLRNSLAARNNVGAYNERNKLHHQVVEYNDRSLNAAKAFFQSNPDFTVADINLLLDQCLQVPGERSYNEHGHDPLYEVRKARDLGYMLQKLDKIVAALNCVDQVGQFQPVPDKTLFPKDKPKP